jgi:hypothetical protein
MLQTVSLGYTQAAHGVRFDAVGHSFSRFGIAPIAMALGLSASGCWLPFAMQMAPVALQATVGLASSVAGAAQNSSEESPGVIELRKDSTGAPEYRELRIAFTSTDAQWTPVVDRDTAADGWRPASHFLQMNFSPPLPSVISDSRITYLAYAPVYTRSADDDNDVQLKEFNRSFGEPVGSFNWNGHPYQYSLPKVLPPLQFE